MIKMIETFPAYDNGEPFMAVDGSDYEKLYDAYLELESKYEKLVSQKKVYVEKE